MAITCNDPVSTGEIETIIESLPELGQQRPRLAAIADFRGCHLGSMTDALRRLASRAPSAPGATGPPT